MGEFGPTLIAGEECAVDGGTVKVVGHDANLLSPHLDVEVTVGDTTETVQWHDEDDIEIGTVPYIVHFKTFEKFAPGLPVANLVSLGV
jgi:hypothetical protein